MMQKKDYYEHPAVQQRMREFMAEYSGGDPTCVRLSTCNGPDEDERMFWPPEDLGQLLEREIDIGRSLWDKHSLIVHLDVEYVNFDFPAEPYLDMERTFDLQQEVELTIERLLVAHGIKPLHLISGRGHHFVWRIRRDSQAYGRLRALAPLSDELRRIYREPQPPDGLTVGVDHGEAFAGLSVLMEYLSHRIKEEAAPHTPVPVELTSVAVGAVEKGREMISLDISEYGDPHHFRIIRVPFSFYSKPQERQKEWDAPEAQALSPLILIPLHEMNRSEAIGVMRDPARAAELARRASVQIPEQSEASDSLLDEYMHSELRRHHEFFYSRQHEPPENWPWTYDRTSMEMLPPCVRFILEHPNDWLLKPAGKEQVVRSMLALGWHPRHVAGLIRSKYERDYGWQGIWEEQEPATRADFYTRLFFGIFACGRDDLVDFTCQSTKEKGFCFQPEETCDLDRFRHSLIERRNHERLAHRPFNRLFHT